MLYPQTPDTQTSLYNETNIARSTLATEINIADGNGAVFSVIDGSAFPLSNFIVAVESEIILIASRSGNNLTIDTRGFEGTAAVTHPIGTGISNTYTAGSRQVVKQSLIDTQNYLFNYKGTVINRTVTDDTVLTPVKYDQYIVAAGGVNGFLGQDGNLAYYDGSAWVFITPVAGDRVYNLDTEQVLRHDGTNWIVDQSIPPYDSTLAWAADTVFIESGDLWRTAAALPPGTDFDPGDAAKFVALTGAASQALPEFYFVEGALIDVPATWTNVLTLSPTVTTAATFEVALAFVFTIASVSQSGEFRFRVDGEPWRVRSIEVKDPSNIESFSSLTVYDLTAGAHVIEFEAQKPGGAQMDITDAYLRIDQKVFL